MSYQPGDRYTAVAGENLSGKRYHIVKLNSDGKVVLAAAATDAIIGVLDNEPKAGETAEVVTVNGQGTFRVKAAAIIAKDAFITSDANGQAVATTTAGNRVIGRAVRAFAAGEIGEYIKANEKY
ncbi:capsid cement protein [Dietzia maris]|uniref:capsid cement protein n=1 Tax=Dietzia maris TaxID=37915 RepID=UPI0037C75A4C